MKSLLIALSFFTAAALACGNPSNTCNNTQIGCCRQGQTPLVETITYALQEMGMGENSDIRTALHLYKKEVRSLSPIVPVEAFQGENFSPGAYALNSSDAKVLKAQIDLFETIYLILNDKQKKEFPTLMGMYQHHMKFINTQKMCAGDLRAYENYKNSSCGSQSCDAKLKEIKRTQKR